MQTFLMVAMLMIAVMLILLVLVQRGKGGGLAGAFGGMGGQSAFGTKAGDLFTRVTIVVAALWIILCMVAVKYSSSSEQEDPAKLGAAAAKQQGAPDKQRATIQPETTPDEPGADGAAPPASPE